MNRRTALSLAVTAALALTTGCGAAGADEPDGTRKGSAVKGRGINL